MRDRPAIRVLAAGLTAAAALCAFAAVAWGADLIRAGGDCCAYEAGSYEMAAGENPSFANAATDGAPHDVTARGKGPDGKALFRSPTIEPDQTASVRGTEYLAPGQYPFFCDIHGPEMSATLRVGPGAAVPRPRLQLTVLSRRLEQVRRSAKLLVKLAGSGSNATGVALIAKAGRATIARKRGISLAAGAVRQLRLSLTARGRAALQGRDRSAIAVTASVEFARPDTARRALR
jgi:plastocyanin